MHLGEHPLEHFKYRSTCSGLFSGVHIRGSSLTVLLVLYFVSMQAELFDRFRQQASGGGGGGGGGSGRGSSDSHSHGHGHGGNKHQASDEEIADANQRNRAISSSAINRALSDANSGLFVYACLQHVYTVYLCAYVHYFRQQ